MIYNPHVHNPMGYKVGWCRIHENRCPDCEGTNLEFKMDDIRCSTCGHRDDERMDSYYNCLDCGKTEIYYPSTHIASVYRVIPPKEVVFRDYKSKLTKMMIFGDRGTTLGATGGLNRFIGEG